MGIIPSLGGRMCPVLWGAVLLCTPLVPGLGPSGARTSFLSSPFCVLSTAGLSRGWRPSQHIYKNTWLGVGGA